MKEINGNLWTAPVNVRIIPTNGVVDRAGNAVMGAGVAAQAGSRYPMLPRELGKELQRRGNHVFFFPAYGLLTFPTKHHWRRDADLELIENSTLELKSFINPELKYAMPRVGTGEGNLDWLTEVRPILL